MLKNTDRPHTVFVFSYLEHEVGPAPGPSNSRVLDLGIQPDGSVLRVGGIEARGRRYQQIKQVLHVHGLRWPVLPRIGDVGEAPRRGLPDQRVAAYGGRETKRQVHEVLSNNWQHHKL